MQDLGTVPGDAYIEGLGMNDRGQVGLSCTTGFRELPRLPLGGRRDDRPERTRARLHRPSRLRQ